MTGRIKAACVAMLVASLAIVALERWTAPPVLPGYEEARAGFRPSEAWLYDRNGRLLDSARVDFERRRLAWVPIDAIAPALRDAVVRSEDRRFRWHGGVDWLALAAGARDRLTGHRARGASTITMQVAAFLSPDLARPGARGWRDKLRQMRAARALERAWSKDALLEAYLNLAPFRGEAGGVGAAAMAMFGKAPAALTPDEAALLAAVLPEPGAAPPVLARRACRLAGGDCARFAALAASATGPAREAALDPGLAPHLSDRLLTAPGLRVRTTIDRSLQRVAAAALRRQLLGLGGTRARDGAVVVVDNASGEVLAYVGGVGGASTAPAVDGAASYRQAGSTLKPFLYAQAMERGWLTPASVLDDSPVQLDTASGLYVPQNYDRGFKGPVSARTALAGSLNVPAVRTLLLVGVDPFRDRLWDAGYRGLTEDGQYYGFSLALGSAEVTLMEQAAAYRALANGGRWSALRVTADAAKTPPRSVFSPQAAWMVADMLADPGARAATFGLDSALRLPFWAAVKTGTSKAMRDNWCVGFSDRFTVAVWVGNLEGDPMRAVSGTSGAAPVWRDVMMALHARSPSRALAPPPGIEARTVSFAGNTEQPRREWFLSGTGQSVIAAVPVAARRARIVSPVAGSVYAVDPDVPPDRQRLAVEVAGAAAGQRLRLDRRPIGAATASPLIFAAPGPHLLALEDEAGRIVDRVIFTVR